MHPCKSTRNRDLYRADHGHMWTRVASARRLSCSVFRLAPHVSHSRAECHLPLASQHAVAADVSRSCACTYAGSRNMKLWTQGTASVLSTTRIYLPPGQPLLGSLDPRFLPNKPGRGSPHTVRTVHLTNTYIPRHAPVLCTVNCKAGLGHASAYKYTTRGQKPTVDEPIHLNTYGLYTVSNILESKG